jgi:hypothetical protein
MKNDADAVKACRQPIIVICAASKQASTLAAP